MIYYSIHFNRPDFVEIQYLLSKKFGYDLIIINNGKNKLIQEMCDKYSIPCVGLDNLDSRGSYSHGNAINSVLKLIDITQPYGILDHDMFITKNINMENIDILSILANTTSGEKHLWPGMLICNKNIDLSNINFTPINMIGDTGCDTRRIINDYNIKFCDIKYLGDKDMDKIQDSSIITECSIDNELIGYHFLNGSNWTNTMNPTNKNKILKELIEKL